MSLEQLTGTRVDLLRRGERGWGPGWCCIPTARTGSTGSGCCQPRCNPDVSKHQRTWELKGPRTRLTNRLLDAGRQTVYLYSGICGQCSVLSCMDPLSAEICRSCSVPSGALCLPCPRPTLLPQAESSGGVLMRVL